MSGVLNLLLAGAASAIKDAYYNLTTLLLNTSSTNGAQNNTFLDSSTNNFSITRNGNTTQGTFTPFSQTGWSNYFNGSSTISFGTSSATNILAYDTFECWVNMPVIGTNDLIAGRDGNFWMGYNFTGIGGTANKFVFSIWTGSSWQAVSSTTTPVVGVWYHLLGVKDNTTMRFYVNGVQENTSTFSGTPVTTGTFYVASNNNIENFEGYISNLRLITGATNAVFPYAGLTTGASFTPPTSALTAVTGTALLTCQSNRFVDNSSNNLSATITSIPSVQAFSPFAPTAAYDAAVVGGSGYFDGTSDYLSLSSTSLNLGANDFTIETWVYATTTARDFVIGSLRNADGAGSWVIMFNDSQPIRFFCRYNGGTVLDYQVGSGTFPINTWTHLAITRSGANLRVFQNGTQVGTTNTTLSTFSIDNASTNYYVASSTDPGEFYTGYLSGTRLLVGTALYTTTFTPPTAPPTAITNTTLLLNYTNAGYAPKGKRASREEMAKVVRGDSPVVKHPWKPEEKPVANEPVTVVWDDVETTAAEDQQTFIADLQNALGASVQGFKCKHGDMLLKDGTGKTGKPYHGYVCGSRTKADQCEARWAKLVSGKWVFEGKAND